MDPQSIGGVARAVTEHQHPTESRALLVRVHLGKLDVSL